MKTAARVNQIPEYYFSRKLAEVNALIRAGQPILNLGIGSPDLMPPAKSVEALRDAAEHKDAYRYKPYRGLSSLREAIGAWYTKNYQIHLNADTEILPLLGSKEGIAYLSLAYLDAGCLTIVPNPGYTAYGNAARIAGASVTDYTLSTETGWHPDVQELESIADDNCRIIWLNYPHMPTATPANHQKLTEVVAFARRRGILICNDNPYSQILSDNPFSIFQIPGAKEVAVELNSLSKSHNLAGARVGMLVGNSQLIAPAFKLKSNFDSGQFAPIQEAAIAALSEGNAWKDKLNVEYIQRREIVFKFLEMMDCTFSQDTCGLFVWARVSENWANGDALSDSLLYKANVFVTPGSAFGTNGQNYIRVSLTSPVEILMEASQRIQSFVNQHNNGHEQIMDANKVG